MVLLGGENADSYAACITELEQGMFWQCYGLQTPIRTGQAKQATFGRSLSGVYLI